MKSELTERLMNHLDKMQECNIRISDINNLIEKNGYTKKYVDLLVDFNVIKTKIKFQIEDTQRGLEIINKSIEHRFELTEESVKDIAEVLRES